MEHLAPGASCWLLFHSSPAFRFPFSRRHILKRKKPVRELSGTNLESLESLNNSYPRPFHSVFWKEKKLAHKNSPLLKLAPLYNSKFNISWFPKSWHNPRGGGGGTQQALYGEGPPRALTPCPFINHFSRNRFPFHTPCIEKRHPFLSPSLSELFIPFKGVVINYWGWGVGRAGKFWGRAAIFWAPICGGLRFSEPAIRGGLQFSGRLWAMCAYY